MNHVEWRPVVGFEGYYFINNRGDVLSLRSGKLRKPVPNNQTGYLYLVLCGKDFHKTVTVHRLVAEAFIDNPAKLPCVNHKDENKHNNLVENLEWCTKEYNNTYNGKTQRCCKKIIQIDSITGDSVIWDSARKADAAGIANYKNISACCRGKRKHAGGYEWRFMCG